jgi:hypothetical protein
MLTGTRDGLGVALDTESRQSYGHRLAWRDLSGAPPHIPATLRLILATDGEFPTRRSGD